MAHYTKEPPTCTSEILFVGTTGLAPIANSPDVPVELYIDVLAPERYIDVYFASVSLYIDILTPGVRMVPHPLTNPSGEWSIWDGTKWVVTLTSTHPSTDRLRLRNFDIHVTSGATNGKTHRTGIVGLADDEALELRAHVDAINAVANTQSCMIHMTDFHVNDRLPGFLK
ncbi:MULTISPECIES: hypothetical protein [Streptomyces]|uniref:hypothetical protein n=1 Tax=Streptomyces TaxID=1883 RepID=UPI00131E840D|nr:MULTISPECIES: hypothetical protein [Streptomyces]